MAAGADRAWTTPFAKLRLFNYAFNDAQVRHVGDNLENDGGAYDVL